MAKELYLETATEKHHSGRNDAKENQTPTQYLSVFSKIWTISKAEVRSNISKTKHSPASLYNKMPLDTLRRAVSVEWTSNVLIIVSTQRPIDWNRREKRRNLSVSQPILPSSVKKQVKTFWNSTPSWCRNTQWRCWWTSIISRHVKK